jgi:CTP:molybdopterin cytidylyltransferase MocA
MGTAKQLLLLDGNPLGRRAAEVALNSDCSSAISVIGERSVGAGGLAVVIVENLCWEDGVGTSIHAGAVGVPVYFAREFFPHLSALKP